MTDQQQPKLVGRIPLWALKQEMLADVQIALQSPYFVKAEDFPQASESDCDCCPCCGCECGEW